MIILGRREHDAEEPEEKHGAERGCNLRVPYIAGGDMPALCLRYETNANVIYIGGEGKPLTANSFRSIHL